MRLERRHALWLPIVLLHGWLWLAHLPRPNADRTPREGSLIVRLLPASAPAKRLSGPPTRPSPRRATTAPARVSPSTPARTPPLPAPDEPLPNGPATAQADAPGPSTPPGPLLHTEATRRAIHLAARAPLLSERAASASDAPARETGQQRFGREVARSAYGNCLKGEFPGAGGGLLSLPMFLIAEASGRCQK